MTIARQLDALQILDRHGSPCVMARLRVFIFLVRVRLNGIYHDVVFHDGKIIDKDLLHELLAHDGICVVGHV